MELYHQLGSFQLQCDSCDIHVDQNFTRVRFSVSICQEAELLQCRVNIPIQANFHLESCCMIVDGIRNKANVVRRTVAKERFKHELTHGSVASKLHVNFDTLVIEIGNITKLEIRLSLLGNPMLTHHILGLNSVEADIHVPCGIQKAKYGASTDDFDQLSAAPPIPPSCIGDFKLTLAKSIKDVRTTSTTHDIEFIRTRDGLDMCRITPKPNSRKGGLLLKVIYKFDDKSCMVQKCSDAFNSRALVLLRSCIVLNEESNSTPKEVVFLMDCSNSMMDCMSMAKNCLGITIKNMPSNNTFNILVFGTQCKFAFRESLQHNPENVSRANSFIDQIFANMGGTDVASAIRHLDGLPASKFRERVVIFITDGCVTSVRECGVEARKAQSVRQWHGIGIGEDASMSLLKEVTMHCNGSYTIVGKKEPEGNAIEAIASSLLLATSECKDVKVHLSNGKTDALLIKSPVTIIDRQPFDVIAAVSDPTSKLTVNVVTTDKVYSIDLDLKEYFTDSRVPEQMAAEHILQFYDSITDASPFQPKQLMQVRSVTSELLGGSDADALCSLSVKTGVLCIGTAVVMVSPNSTKDILHGTYGFRISNGESSWVSVEKPTIMPRGSRADQLYSSTLAFKGCGMNPSVERYGFPTLGGGYISPWLCGERVESDGGGGGGGVGQSCLRARGSNTVCESVEAGGGIRFEELTENYTTPSESRLMMKAVDLTNKGKFTEIIQSMHPSGSWDKLNFPTTTVNYQVPPNDINRTVVNPNIADSVWCTLLVLNYLFHRKEELPVSVQLIYNRAHSYVQKFLTARYELERLIRNPYQ